MIQTPMVLTVTQLNTYIKSQFESDENLSHVFITGEISNFTNNYRSGHLYFSLKDDKSVIRAVMFSRSASRLRFQPQDGMKVIARGRVGVYEVSGQYQLYVEDLQPDGLGALNLAFEQLKAKLEKEGLFSAERKRPLPEFPHSIGVITSPTGAAVHDILTILERRYPLAQVVFCPVQVQGGLAAPQIVSALHRMNRLKCADVIIVGRGGGSLEDLWPFNEEAVARAVAASVIPVISAVGHETDFTICDFAADMRAPTPSAAAELAVPDKTELLGGIQAERYRLQNAVSARLAEARGSFVPLAESRVLKNPLEPVELRRVQIDQLLTDLTFAMRRREDGAKEQLANVSGRLNALSPLAVLSRGYAVVFSESGQTVPKMKEIHKDDKILVQMADGSLRCTVNDTKPESGKKKATVK
ncbi:MAG TPA: exodeoxyribonuclease VII large subunit [Caproicibacter sp.]|nr:exodeoxyribonuclease VII large subunit [Caproicibacter sp.]